MAIRALHTAEEATSSAGGAPFDEDSHIGGRLRELRKAKSMTLQEVADGAGISVSYLSQIERNVSRLPIGVLKKISDVLGVHMNWFFPPGSDGPAEERDLIVRAANRRNLSFTGLGITEELLSPNLSGPLELLISTLHPGADSEFYAHDGHETGLVLNGTTGESPTTTDSEKRRLLEVVVEEVPCPFDAGPLFQHFYTATSMLHQVQHTQGMGES